MKSNNQSEIKSEIQNDILTPKDAWELFSWMLRVYGDKNESYFFKLICFYYFGIHLKKSLNEFHIFEAQELHDWMTIRKNDIISLIWNFLLEGAKKGWHTSPEALQGFIKSMVLNIMNIFQDEKELPKFCYNFATKLKNNRSKTHNTLMIKDELFRILPMNSYSTIYSYVGQNNKLTQGIADIKQVDPWAFEQAWVTPIDTLKYFFELDGYKSVSELIQNHNIIKNLVSLTHKRNEVELWTHMHKNISIANIDENRNTINATVDYVEELLDSSRLHALLHETFKYYKRLIFEERRYIDKNVNVQEWFDYLENKTIFDNEMEYIYHAIHDLQQCTQEQTKKENEEKIDTEVFMKFLVDTYPTTNHIHDIFWLLAEDKKYSILQISDKKFIIKTNSRWVTISCKENHIDLQYFSNDRIIWTQQIWITPHGISTSKYNIPQETTKLKQWCNKYYVTDYVTDQSRVAIDEYLLQIQDLVNERWELHPWLDKKNAYMKYILENCFSWDLDVWLYKNIVTFTNQPLNSETIQDIKDNAYTQYIDWLYNIYNKWLHWPKIKRRIKWIVSPAVEERLKRQKKKVFQDALSTIWIQTIEKESFKEALHIHWGTIIEKTKAALSFIISEQRAAPAISTYEEKKNMSLEDLIDLLVLEKIHIKKSPEEKTSLLQKVYELCNNYDILPYLHNEKVTSPVKDKIIAKFNEYITNGIKKHSDLSGKSDEDTRVDGDLFFIKAPTSVREQAEKFIYTNLHKQYEEVMSIAILSMQKAILERNKKDYDIHRSTYEWYIKDFIKDIEKEYPQLLPSWVWEYIKIKSAAIWKIIKMKEKIPVWWEREMNKKMLTKIQMQIATHNAKIYTNSSNYIWYEEESKRYQDLTKNLEEVLLEEHKEKLEKLEEQVKESYIYKEYMERLEGFEAAKQAEIAVSRSSVVKVQTDKEIKDGKKKKSKKVLTEEEIIQKYDNKALKAKEVYEKRIKRKWEMLEYQRLASWKIDRTIALYKKSFPQDEVVVTIPINILKKYYNKLTTYSLEAISALKDNTVVLYEELQSDFYKILALCKEDIELHYNVQETDTFVIDRIRQSISRMESLFPTWWLKKALLQNEWVILKNKLKKITFEALSHLIYNKQEEYEVIKDEFEKWLHGLEKHYENEIVVSSLYKKVSQKEARNIGEKIKSFDSRFPTKKWLWISTAREYDDKSFHEHLMEIELGKMSFNAQNILLEKKPVGISYTGEKSFLGTMDFLKPSLDKVPYVDDIYATFLLWETKKYNKERQIAHDKWEEYIKRHFIEMIENLIEKNMIEDFLTHYIQIEDSIVKDNFIEKIHYYIKSYITSKYNEDINNRRTYAHYIWSTILWEESKKNEQVSGSIKVDLPLLPEIRENEVEDIEYQEE